MWGWHVVTVTWKIKAASSSVFIFSLSECPVYTNNNDCYVWFDYCVTGGWNRWISDQWNYEILGVYMNEIRCYWLGTTLKFLWEYMRITNSEAKKKAWDDREFGQDTSLHLLVWKEKIQFTQKNTSAEVLPLLINIIFLLFFNLAGGWPLILWQDFND